MKPYLLLAAFAVPLQIFAQQIADTAYKAPIKHPHYRHGTGTVVHIDEGHHNFHTKEGRYKPFSNVLEQDGYRVKEFSGEFTAEKLAGVEILVIANAVNEANNTNWYRPVYSAFTIEEIAAVNKWVNGGGKLFLIADHMPMAGAAKDLAAAFGFEFTDGFAVDTNSGSAAHFYISDGTLKENEITRGKDTSEAVTHVATFTGHAFKIPSDATPILIFNDKYINYLPDTAWVITNNTPAYSVKGWSQGAFKKSGKGKVVAFGEAAMFSAQLTGAKQRKVGMNNGEAPENYRLLLNIIHWLDKK